MSDKTLDVVNIEDAKLKVSDIKVIGNGDMFQLLCKASSKSQGWMKSTKAMLTEYGAVIQVTTQQGDNVAEALTTLVGSFVIVDDVNGGKKLVDKFKHNIENKIQVYTGEPDYTS